MIFMIQGRPRSGKSYEAVRYHIIPAIKKGRKVITNLPLNIAYFKKVFGDDVVDLIEIVSFNYDDFESNSLSYPFSKPSDYEDSWRDAEGKGPLYVIDECHFSLPKGGTPKPVKKFYTMHGHYGIDILLMTQHLNQVDTDIRNLIELTHRCIKNTYLGNEKTYTKKVIEGHRGKAVNVISDRPYDKEFFRFYKSHTQSKNAVSEANASDIKSMRDHWTRKWSIVLCVFSLIPLALFLNQMFGSDEPDVSSKQAVSTRTVEVRGGKVSSPGELASSTPASSKKSSEGFSRKPPYPHPYHKVDLHVAGFSESGNVKNLVKKYYFTASKSGLKLFQIDMNDLYRAGYTVNVLSDCLVYVAYYDYEDYLTCDHVDEEQEGGRAKRKSSELPLSVG